MKKVIITLLFAVVPMLYVSSQVKVTYDRSNSIDFTAYKTYQIITPEISENSEYKASKSNIELLVNEVGNQMTLRGCKKVTENPDLIINIGINIESKNQTRETSFREAPKYMGQRNYHWESEEVVVSEYIEGSVALDFVDAERNKMIWQVNSSRVLSEKSKNNEKLIIKTVKKIFKKYPVPELKE